VNTAAARAATESPPSSLTEQVAAFACAFDLTTVPPPVVSAAKYCILDALGIALASTRFDFAARSAAGVAALGGQGTHPVIGMPLRLCARDAALLNGILIHGLDYDDTHSASVIHASASALPVVLAAGAQHGASGARAIAAYLLAVELDARLGQHAGGWWQKVGFHPTGMVGIFGATLAASYLAGLNAQALAYAQGIALSMAAGSMEFLEDGSWTKRLHPGWAASSAIAATTLSQHGFVAPLRSYEGRFGLFNSYLGAHAPQDHSQVLRGLGSQWEMLNVALKPYPVCHFNHACGDAALALRARHDLRWQDIDSIIARIHRNQMQVVCDPPAAKRRPQSEYDAKFSLQYFIAAMLVKGRFTLAELEADCRHDAEVLALCDRIVCEHDPQSAFPQYYSGDLEIVLRDGRRLKHREQVNRGADANPLSTAEIEGKFFANAERAVSHAQAEQIRSAVLGLDLAPNLAALTAALCVVDGANRSC
jgi:2-methylcitrate dehydratase PrpD